MVKGRFSSIDIKTSIKELQSLEGVRVANIYDVDKKTYLFKLSRGEEKNVLLIESGIRIHTTGYDWPKGPMPSNFCAKLRKHIRTRRLNSIRQLGIDRVIDLEFGFGENLTHVIVELYAKGNIILTDGRYVILSILRKRMHVVSEGEKDENADVRIAVGEVYPFETVRATYDEISEQDVIRCLESAKPKDNLKKTLSFSFEYGPSVIEHALLMKTSIKPQVKTDTLVIEEVSGKILAALKLARSLVSDLRDPKGFIIQKKEKRVNSDKEESFVLLNEEYHPMLYKQHANTAFKEYDTFNLACDEFYSSMQGQKLDMKALQQERQALKKLENLKIGHQKRLDALEASQESDVRCAQLIEANLELVDKAIEAVLSLVAAQLSWDQIEEMVKEAQESNDPVATYIASLRLERNAITLLLTDWYEQDEDDEDEPTFHKVEVTLDESAYGNARSYYGRKKVAQKKHEKTVDVSEKALKSVEKATMKELKEVEKCASINKSRKVYWFEKFIWFITSENYLVIGGHDAQQNEMIVKKYLKKGDLYVHAEIHGAATCVIKNTDPNKKIPPKSINEAGAFSICHSSGWDAKIVISAYYVHHDQVSKTAPTGEYLTTGSFMIRGKKNFLPPSQLVMGYGFVFKLDPTSIGNHKNERRVVFDEEEEDETKGKKMAASAKEYEERSHKIQQREKKIKESEVKPMDEPPIDEDTTIEEQVGNRSTQEEVNGPSKEESGGDDSESESEEEFPETNITQPYSSAPSTSTMENQDEEENDDVDNEENDDTKPDDESSRKYLTAQQRRLLKKGLTLEEIEERQKKNQEQRQIENEILKIKKEEAKKRAEQNQVTNAPRGKRGKNRKMKEKYGDQDEDERQMRMDLLKSAGTAKPKGKAAKKREAQRKKTEIREEAKQTKKGEEVYKQLVKIEKLDNNQADEDGTENRDSVLAARQERRLQKQKEAEEVKKIMEEENLEEDDDNRENLTILDALTGVPLENDLLLHAMVFCAPYSVLSNFKYKVKLTPGGQKKGKASKSARDLFLRNSEGVEKDLIRAVSDNELVQQMPGKVKISAPQYKAANVSHNRNKGKGGGRR